MLAAPISGFSLVLRLLLLARIRHCCTVLHHGNVLHSLGHKLEICMLCFPLQVHSLLRSAWPTRLSAPICCILSLILLLEPSQCFPPASPFQSRCFIKFCNGNSKSIAKCAALNFNCANFAARPKMRKESKQREGGSQVIITLVFLASIITYINIFIFCCCLFLLVVISFALAWYWVWPWAWAWACASAWACNAPWGIIEIVCAILHSKG